VKDGVLEAGWEQLTVGALEVAKALTKVLKWAISRAVGKAENLALGWADSLGLVTAETMGMVCPRLVCMWCLAREWAEVKMVAWA